MSILKELLGTLLENDEMPKKPVKTVELDDIVKFFPGHHEAAIRKLWGTERLTWHGKKFFEGEELGDVYIEAEDAVDAVIQDVKVDGQITLSPVYRSGLPELEFEDDFVEWEITFGKQDKQEVYLGYDPETDKLYMGFDAWANEQDYNDAFDDEFKRIVGEEFDYENEVHAAIAQQAWEAYQKGKLGFYGIIFEISIDKSSNMIDEAEELPEFTNAGGFYRGVYTQFKSRYPHVLDLRLD